MLSFMLAATSVPCSGAGAAMAGLSMVRPDGDAETATRDATTDQRKGRIRDRRRGLRVGRACRIGYPDPIAECE